MGNIPYFYNLSKHIGQNINTVKPILEEKFPDRQIHILDFYENGIEIYYAKGIYIHIENDIIRRINFSSGATNDIKRRINFL